MLFYIIQKITFTKVKYMIRNKTEELQIQKMNGTCMKVCK